MELFILDTLAFSLFVREMGNVSSDLPVELIRSVVTFHLNLTHKILFVNEAIHFR